MIFLQKTRQSIGTYYMNKAARSLKRNREISNFREIKSIGLVFDLNSPTDYDAIKDYIAFLKDEHKKVKGIGFFDSNKLPAYTYSKIDFITINKKNTNWLFKPEPKILQDFISEEFDVLINLSMEDCFTLRYFITLSKARCKIGCFKKDNENLYDMMISLGENKNLKYYTEQLNIYLNMINRKPVPNIF